jgi:hypothetical protein
MEITADQGFQQGSGRAKVMRQLGKQSFGGNCASQHDDEQAWASGYELQRSTPYSLTGSLPRSTKYAEGLKDQTGDAQIEKNHYRGDFIGTRSCLQAQT